MHLVNGLIVVLNMRSQVSPCLISPPSGSGIFKHAGEALFPSLISPARQPAPNSILGNPEVLTVRSRFLAHGFCQILGDESCMRIYVKAGKNVVLV